ncbi:MAG: helix-turn-helix domain-containing protein, partial [Streptococcaceae bacterium]|nr:helix-turn-helix domain-containing protein [Streptococcaceae bacterium]
MKRIDLNVTETKKYQTIKLVAEGRKTKQRASAELALTVRQVNRLVVAYKTSGKASFVHGNRGTRPRHAMPESVRAKILELYHEYPLAPNFVHFTEDLSQKHGIVYSDTTIRKLLYQEGILSPKSQRKTRKKFKAQARRKNEEIAKVNTLLPL